MGDICKTHRHIYRQIDSRHTKQNKVSNIKNIILLRSSSSSTLLKRFLDSSEMRCVVLSSHSPRVPLVPLVAVSSLCHGDAKVSDLHRSIQSNQDILRLDVQMHDPALVNVF